jgi:hypothetical protein
MDTLTALQLITQYIRQARAGLAEDLAEIERSELARVKPSDYMPDYLPAQGDS